MKTFLGWLSIILFLGVIFFLVSKLENKQTYQQSITTVEEKKLEPETQVSREIEFIKIGGVQVKVETALTPEAKTKGLSGRAGLEENTGMVFVFPTPGKYAFWMKGMNFPIDIIWITDNYEIVYIKKNVPQSSYPETFRSEENASYVLEVPASFSEKHNLQVGDKVEFFF